MFLSKYFKRCWPQIRHFTRNYQEAGHGKGAADGIGGTCKRTADSMVAKGVDIPDIKVFITELQKKLNKINIVEINQDNIDEIAHLYFNGVAPIKAFAGTLKVHQVMSSNDSQNLFMRTLSCEECSSGLCNHFHCGIYNAGDAKLTVAEVYTDSAESQDEEGPTEAKIGLFVVVHLVYGARMKKTYCQKPLG